MLGSAMLIDGCMDASKGGKRHLMLFFCSVRFANKAVADSSVQVADADSRDTFVEGSGCLSRSIALAVRHFSYCCCCEVLQLGFIRWRQVLDLDDWF